MKRTGFALIEILVVLVIMLILAGGYFGLKGGGKGKPAEKVVHVWYKGK